MASVFTLEGPQLPTLLGRPSRLPSLLGQSSQIVGGRLPTLLGRSSQVRSTRLPNLLGDGVELLGGLPPVVSFGLVALLGAGLGVGAVFAQKRFFKKGVLKGLAGLAGIKYRSRKKRRR